MGMPIRANDLRTVLYDSRALDGQPTPDAFLLTPGGKRYYRIIEAIAVRAASQATKRPIYRIVAAPVHKARVPGNAKIITVKRDWRTTGAKVVEPGPPERIPATPAEIMHSRETDRARARARVANLLDGDKRDGRMVPSIRTSPVIDQITGEVIRDATAEAAEWRDPDDADPNRRSARKVSGFRASDQLHTLYKRGTLITSQHIAAANRWRRDHDLAEGARPGYEKPEPSGTSFGPGQGPQERQLAALRAVEEARAALGSSLCTVLTAVVLQNWTVRSYAKRTRITEMVAMGILVAALDRLVEHYTPQKQRHTIRV